MQLVRNRELVKRGANISLTNDYSGKFERGFFGFLCVERLIIYDQPDLE